MLFFSLGGIVVTIAFRTGLYSLALALLVASSVPAPRVSAPSDANADFSIDVRDVQLVGAALLDSAHPVAAADVNGDGQVDVLDFQQVVNEASAQQNPSNSSQNTPPQHSPNRPAHESIALRAASVISESLPPAEPRVSPSARPTALPDSQRTRLARLGLAAHAPPAI